MLYYIAEHGVGSKPRVLFSDFDGLGSQNNTDHVFAFNICMYIENLVVTLN